MDEEEEKEEKNERKEEEEEKQTPLKVKLVDRHDIPHNNSWGSAFVLCQRTTNC